jgi:hypothetical protein
LAPQAVAYPLATVMTARRAMKSLIIISLIVSNNFKSPLVVSFTPFAYAQGQFIQRFKRRFARF